VIKFFRIIGILGKFKQFTPSIHPTLKIECITKIKPLTWKGKTITYYLCISNL